MSLGISYGGTQEAEQVRWFQAAVVVAPANPAAHNNLGVVLWARGDLEGAVVEYREALRLDRGYAAAHNNLGVALRDQEDLGGAQAEFREAFRLDRRYATPHNNLGVILGMKGDLDGALKEIREAIRLDPRDAKARNDLGLTLAVKGDRDGAIDAYREAIRIDPGYAWARNNLGVALREKGDLNGAVEQFQEHTRLDPRNADAHVNLGDAQQARGNLDEAVDAYRKAIWLRPSAVSHYNLGNLLRQTGRLAEAERAYSEAVRLDGNHHGAAIDALADLQLVRGNLDGALATYQKSLQLKPEDQAARAGLAHARQLRELLPRLPGVLAGKEKPRNPAEGCAFADLCAQPFQKRYAEAARLYTEAFVADPGLAEDLKAGHRYNAACCAALAGLRKQSLDWLRADLALNAKHLQGDSPQERILAQQRLEHWQRDDDLNGVRGSGALGKLPAGERAAWVQLWTDVETLLRKVRGRKGGEG
jgi:tetratricopeptide (TPR) repeat protein